MKAAIIWFFNVTVICMHTMLTSPKYFVRFFLESIIFCMKVSSKGHTNSSLRNEPLHFFHFVCEMGDSILWAAYLIQQQKWASWSLAMCLDRYTVVPLLQWYNGSHLWKCNRYYPFSYVTCLHLSSCILQWIKRKSGAPILQKLGQYLRSESKIRAMGGAALSLQWF